MIEDRDLHPNVSNGLNCRTSNLGLFALCVFDRTTVEC